MSGSAFPTAFTGLTTPARTDAVLADNGTANGLLTIAQIMGLLALTDIPQGGATNGQGLLWSGTAWAPGNVSAGGGITSDQLASAVAGLITPAELTASIAGLVTPAELQAAIAGLVTTAQQAAAIAGLVTTAQLTAALAGLGSGGSVSGETLDQETAAQAMSDTDAFPVAQPSIAGGALSTIWRGTLSQLWSYITGKMPGYHIPIIELTGNTILDGPTHNRRLLICTTSLSLSMPTTFGVLAGAGVAFEAEVQVETGATLALPTTGATITGPVTIVGPAQARLRAWTTSGGVNRLSCSSAQGAQSQAILLGTPSNPYPGTSYTVIGSLSLYSSAPTLTISVDGGAFTSLPTGSTVSSTTFSLAMPGIAAGSHTIQVKDAAASILSNTISFSAAITEGLTVVSPGAQAAGTAFTLTGGYSGIQPTALDYSVDGKTTWTASTSPTISTISGGSGTYSFAVTIASANASQVVWVRDHNAQSVLAVSATFAVGAATAGPHGPTMLFTSPGFDTTTAKFGQALNAGYGRVTLPTVVAGETITVEMWFKQIGAANTKGAGRNLLFWDVATGRGVGIESGGAMFMSADTYLSGVQVGNKLDGNWHHLVATLASASSGMSVWVDGQVWFSNYLSFPISGSPTLEFDTVTGSANSTVQSTGPYGGCFELDEIAIYAGNGPYTPGVAFTSPTTPLTGSETNLIAVYPLDGNGASL